FYMRVPGGKVLEADRPVNSIAITGRTFEVILAPTLSLAGPKQRLAAYLVASNPIIWLLLYVRVLIIFYKEMLCCFVKCIASVYNWILFLRLHWNSQMMRKLPG